MRKLGEVTCGDCYFRGAGLCALQLEAPCPTFRHHAIGSLAPPRQAPLVPRPDRFVAARPAAQHAAA